MHASIYIHPAGRRALDEKKDKSSGTAVLRDQRVPAAQDQVVVPIMAFAYTAVGTDHHLATWRRCNVSLHLF